VTRLPRHFILLLTAAMLAALSLAPMAQATVPGTNGKIAFTTDRDGNNEIYTINADGSNPTRLTNNASNDDGAAWSPDGTKIAFASFRDGNWEIYVMNADGTGQVNRTNNAAAYEVDPAWSPDGQKIAFMTARDGNDEIYTMNADGTAQTRRTNNSGSDSRPSWSPDGTKIAFQSNRSGEPEIWTINPDGTGEALLVHMVCSNAPPGPPASAWTPDWSPNGGKVMFTSDEDLEGSNCTRYSFPDEIDQVNADGSGLQTLIKNPNPNLQQYNDPSFSPSGALIVYTNVLNPLNEPQPSEIETRTIDGANLVNLTNNPANDFRPAWQPLHPAFPTPTAPTLDVYLTPAFRQTISSTQCSATGRTPTTHGAPDLPGGANPDLSCNPPAGTPGSTARIGPLSVGSVHEEVVSPADITIQTDITDVRNASGADYDPAAGADLTVVEKIRLSDSYNGASLTNPGTVTDFDLSAPVACTPTASATLGSHCTANTSANAIIPGMVKVGKSAVFNIFRVRVKDPGPDNIRGNADDKDFLQQGLFAP
jgi:Tol biopolymer transport system component